ncbi:MAG: four helix bundle protein [Flavobacterium sp.]|nr:four helix bundle protein [Flavobacterium sp.]MDI9364848.1 four helix bundle protein [Flavobacterium sp.]
MKTNNLIVDKSFVFSVRIVKLFSHLRSKKVERELCAQLLKSGTSIGANIEEALGGSSKKDFIYKLEIAYREARETKYWLRVLNESDLFEKKLADSFIIDCDELLKLLTAIINSSKK